MDNNRYATLVPSDEKIYYFKKNVPYSVGVRYYIKDTLGKTLTGNDPYIAIRESQLRDFKRANKHHLNEGLLIETTEPELDDDTPNAISDEQAEALVKNAIILKRELAKLTAPAPVLKLLAEAKRQKRPAKTIELIENKLRDLVGETPEDMQGVSWGQQGELK